MSWVRSIVCVFIYLVSAGNVASEPDYVIDMFTADGDWCPMAHCNRLDNSTQEITPLFSVGEIQHIASPAVAYNLLGCVSGATVAICAYNHTDQPALVAFDPVSGDKLWSSPLEDLPEAREGRNVAGLLLARMGVNGNSPKRFVFTGNMHELVAYHALSGTLVWRRSSVDITPDAPDGIGEPVSFSYTDNKELVTVTNHGWVVKLDPVNGTTIDAYKMETSVPLDGMLYQGVFITKNSPAIVGNTMYLVVEFSANHENPLPNPDYAPVYVVRIELDGADDGGIKPILNPVTPTSATPDRALIGVGGAGGSPPAMLTEAGSVMVIADADAVHNGGLVPAIAAVEDVAGELKRRWRMILPSEREVLAAPALYAPTKTLLINSLDNIYVLRDVDTMSGELSVPEPIDAAALLTCADTAPRLSTAEGEEIRLGAPMAVAYSQATNELVVYTNFRRTSQQPKFSHGHLVAFAIPAKGTVNARPLWCHALDETTAPDDENRQGALGQPALFITEEAGGKYSNLIVNTFKDGTFIFRSKKTLDIPGDLSELYSRIVTTPTVNRMVGAGYQARSGFMVWPDGCPEGDEGCTRFVNNPITRYGQAYIPAGEWGELSTRFRLDGNDAFVLLGKTPDPITYFSHTMNQFAHYYAELDDYFTTVSSISLSINQANINSIGGQFDGFFALVVAARHGVMSRVSRALVEAGIPEAAINRIQVPAHFFNKSIAPYPDELTFVTRLTHRTLEGEAIVNAYAEQGGEINKILFFDYPGGEGDVTEDDLPRWQERLRLETAEINSGVDKVLNWLIRRIKYRYEAQGYSLHQVGTERLQHVDPDIKCRDVPASCNFDAPDALYARFFCADEQACLQNLPNRKDFFIIVGVDHHRFAQDTLGTYFSYSVTRYKDLAGIATLIDQEMVGSSEQYVEGTAVDASNLFAIKMARDCGGEPYCLEIPWGEEGIPQYDNFMVTARIYLDQRTGSAPNPDNFIPAQILWFKKD